MNRISKRSADEAAEALLEAGRTQPVLQYDVELGLARHHHWLRSEAPMPEWASTSAGTAAKSLMPIVTKTLVSVVLMGALGVATWQARSRPPSSSPGTERTQGVAPGVRDVPASEALAAPKPLPVPNEDLPSEMIPARRNVRADVPSKHATHAPRARKEVVPTHAASARGEPAVPRAEETAPPRSSGELQSSPARVESAASSAAQPSATPREAAPNSPRPEPGRRAQAPDDVAEMQQVASAEQLLERSPARALARVIDGDRRFAHGYFQQERAYIAIMALIRLGRIEEARARAASFDKQFPALPYGARIHSALEAESRRGAPATGQESRRGAPATGQESRRGAPATSNGEPPR